VLSELPRRHPDHAAIAAGYRRMMAALLHHQSDSGMWRQLIDRSEAWKETSGTAMFGFAMQTGAARGILRDPAYAAAARRAWGALAGYVGADGKLSDVCVGTGQSKDAAYYLARPRATGDLHGQAALLWFAAAMIGR
jgi:unsaturated rhamnogalacturonyl hydrolase